MGKRSKNKIAKGGSALTKMIKSSTDQVANFAKSRYTGKQSAANIAKDLQMLGRILNIERKESLTQNAVVTVTNSAPLVQACPSVAQGTTGSTRTGDSIKVVRLDIKLLFNYGTGTSNSICNQIFDYYIVRWLKTPSSSGATPFNISDFLIADVNSAYTPMSLPNNDLMEDFQILANGRSKVSSNFATSATNTMYDLVDLSIDCDFHQTFTGAAATTIVDNSLFIVVVALNPINTGGNSQLISSARLWFVDN